MSKLDKWTLGVITIFIIIGGIVGYVKANDYVMVTQEIVVEKGDTIYNTVARTVNEKNNINEVVARAIRENNIADAGNIAPGTKLTITFRK